MYRLASNMSSKVRVANNSISAVCSWSRNYIFGGVQFPLDKVKWPEHCDVVEKSFDPIYNIARLEKAPFVNLACDMVEEGFWLNLLYRGGASGVGFDSRGIKYRPILTYTLSDALHIEGAKALEEGDDVLYIIDDIKDAVWVVCQYLKRIARPIKRYEEIFQVATTAANGDKTIGQLVAKAIEKVGKDGFFWVYGKKRSENILEFVNLMKVDWGFTSHNRFEKCVLKNPLILIHEKKILKEDVLKQAIRLRQPLLIVAEDVDLDLAKSLRLDPSCHGTKLCVVRPPEHENNRKAIMQDLAVLTGGQIVTSESDVNLIPQMLGSCKEVTVSRDTMAILGGSGCQEDIEERRKQLMSQISLSTWTSNYELKLLVERLGKFSSEAAVFKVGGASEAEVDKYHCRVANAVNAVVAALENGIVASGGVALFHASKKLDKLHATGFNMRNSRRFNKKHNRKRLGVQLVQNVLKAPVASIAYTAGFDHSAVVKKLLEEENPYLGYDPAKDEYTNLIRSGIVDPVQFIVNELKDSVWYCTSTFGNAHSDLKIERNNRPRKKEKTKDDPARK